MCLARVASLFLIASVSAKSAASRGEVTPAISQESQLCAAGVLIPGWSMGVGAGSTLKPNARCQERRHLLQHANGTQCLCAFPSGALDICVPPETRRVLTIGYLYYRSPADLGIHIAHWISMPSHTLDLVEFSLIDDGSPVGERASDVILNRTRGTVSSMYLIVWHITQDIKWNIGGARNLLVATARTPYVYICDMDVMVTPAFIHAIVTHAVAESAARMNDQRRGKQHTEKVYMLFSRQGPYLPSRSVHPALMMISTKAYWRSGGCDEQFVGHYGFTDPHVKYRIAHTPFIRSIRADNIHAIPPVIYLSKDLDPRYAEVARAGKSSSRNFALFDALKRGRRKQWAQEYLHFDWECALATFPESRKHNGW
mmetsp:Transcript_18573/g.54378  ORF Transcript_18573/g.54378 Transcript_18573/m.54378 type:complete len:370 (+) Transcript_18573:1292-2401(+)|eukprot:CAMPEP_0206038088 /NCGR_PEP_ID=MMETSP1466-20131121/3872_1 /ASSEMBLY_ACC=CAM_ASM_001126 /TAXON_ID=44452 /ORGANISM="Pavlova gyrans, Strain CCMP608" /LENGTH=369 /DNA_ID=CAMNT_0053412675 /DNA_START=1220 /DNA_END=2329 /DNA_ORIENTATION=+